MIKCLSWWILFQVPIIKYLLTHSLTYTQWFIGTKYIWYINISFCIIYYQKSVSCVMSSIHWCTSSGHLIWILCLNNKLLIVKNKFDVPTSPAVFSYSVTYCIAGEVVSLAVGFITAKVHLSNIFLYI